MRLCCGRRGDGRIKRLEPILHHLGQCFPGADRPRVAIPQQRDEGVGVEYAYSAMNGIENHLVPALKHPSWGTPHINREVPILLFAATQTKSQMELVQSDAALRDSTGSRFDEVKAKGGQTAAAVSGRVPIHRRESATR
ncbi:hypothetical protein BASA62_005083 [Batrachochytrium salamandrivorans]|nr:hypothetical protein BASA62_005083 [Batrachochytrium salamandrivorans]